MVNEKKLTAQLRWIPLMNLPENHSNYNHQDPYHPSRGIQFSVTLVFRLGSL